MSFYVFCLYFLNALGINIFLDGFVPTENLRFRETSLVFKVSESATDEEIKRMCRYDYPNMQKLLGMYFEEQAIHCITVYAEHRCGMVQY